jgi:hypothetical protein
MAFVDPAALEAAVLNVALNARDAMPDGGSLTLRTSRVGITDPLTIGEDLKPGAYAVLALEDTGRGMPPEIAARAFEPFFTTKTGGGGTGLGLSMVYGFAKQSGGAARSCGPGRGTTVTLFLPLAGEGAAACPDCRAGRGLHSGPHRLVVGGGRRAQRRAPALSLGPGRDWGRRETRCSRGPSAGSALADVLAGRMSGIVWPTPPAQLHPACR